MKGDLGIFQIFAAAGYCLPALVWGVIAHDLWSAYVARRPLSRLGRLLPFLTSAIAGFYAIGVLLWLLPLPLLGELRPGVVALFVTSDALLLLAVAMFRHASLLFPLREQPPSRRWLLANYALPLFLVLFPNLLPGPPLWLRVTAMRIAYFSYIVVVLFLSSRQIARYARRGIWRPGGLGEARYADIFMLAIGLVGICLLFFLEITGDPEGPPPRWGPTLGGAVGLILAAPFVARRLAEVTRRCLLVLASVGVIVVAYDGVERLAAATGSDDLRPVFDLARLFVPALLVLAVQTPLRAAVDWVVLRRNRRRRADLRACLLELSPDLGVRECCRRGLEALVRIMRLRGAAVAFEPGSEWIVAGQIDVEPLRRCWRVGTAHDRAYSAETLRELPSDLQEAFVEAYVTGMTPILSPRRRWGHLFFAARRLSIGVADEDLRTIESFVEPLALVLDAAELLERALGVERSLAHSEKLAAIGELSARIAHEIRNPVTAARSLAQQLVREPSSPFRQEHELILQELGRIERQVASLLQFARREEFEFAAIDLGALVESTAADLRSRCEGEGIVLEVRAPGDVMVRADREKLRQVLMNLCENGIDAMRKHGGARRLELVVAARDGHATLRVLDSGPGVDGELLGKIFEPFFSLKENGTGLGLAIAKRTIDAHGGRIRASSPGGGMVFEIELPLASDRPRRSDGGGARAA